VQPQLAWLLQVQIQQQHRQLMQRLRNSRQLLLLLPLVLQHQMLLKLQAKMRRNKLKQLLQQLLQ